MPSRYKESMAYQIYARYNERLLYVPPFDEDDDRIIIPPGKRFCRLNIGNKDDGTPTFYGRKVY